MGAGLAGSPRRDAPHGLPHRAGLAERAEEVHVADVQPELARELQQARLRPAEQVAFLERR